MQVAEYGTIAATYKLMELHSCIQTNIALTTLSKLEMSLYWHEP